jgi:hypothetical protein
MVTTYTEYHSIVRDIVSSLNQTSEKKPVALETAYFEKTIGSIKSIDDFLGNTRLFKYVMKAFGLEDLDYAKGLVRKVLSDGVDSATSLARRMSDDRFLALATTFNFARDGANATAKTAARQGVVDRYVRQTLEDSAGADNQGVRLALYFQRQAPNLTSAYGILADSALTKVVETALGLPDAMAAANIDTQAAAITQRLNISDLKDPAKVDHLIGRFAAAWDATDTTTADPVLSLFGTSGTPSLDLDLILTLNTLKHGTS